MVPTGRLRLIECGIEAGEKRAGREGLDRRRGNSPDDGMGWDGMARLMEGVETNVRDGNLREKRCCQKNPIELLKRT